MNAFLFDIDGVISIPETQKPDTEVVLKICKILTHSKVGFITGRSLVWIEENIIPTIKKNAENNSLKDALLIGEFGAVHAEYKNGKFLKDIETDLIPPTKIKEDALMLAKKFSESIVEQEKEAIITFAARPNFPLEKFQVDRDRLITLLEPIVEKYSDFVIHKDNLAINIMHKSLDKKFGTQKFLTWAGDIEHAYAFGDNHSDLKIAEGLVNGKIPFDFVYVGNPEEIDTQNLPYQIHIMGNKFTKGTLEFLEGLKI